MTQNWEGGSFSLVKKECLKNYSAVAVLKSISIFFETHKITHPTIVSVTIIDL